MSATSKELFPLGQLVITQGAEQALRRNVEMPFTMIWRHQTGDWGEVDPEDWKSNDEAVIASGRVLSAYRLEDQTKIWVITEWDRSVTTILLPDEY